MFASDLGDLFSVSRTIDSDMTSGHPSSRCGMSYSQSPGLLAGTTAHSATYSHSLADPPPCPSLPPPEPPRRSDPILVGATAPNTTSSPHTLPGGRSTSQANVVVDSLSARASHVPSKPMPQFLPLGSAQSRGSLRCPFCDKQFSNSSAIAKHKLTHSEERKYVCSICQKAFKRQDHLNGHKYTHETKKPHACHFCDKSYSDARSLRRHYENTHPDEYERWLVLSQATNGDTSAIAVAAAALLSSTGLEATDLISSTAQSQASAGATTSAASLFNALNNPVCKLLASGLSQTVKPEGSPLTVSTATSTHVGSSRNSVHLPDSKTRSNRPDWFASTISPHSSQSGCYSLSASPAGTADTADPEVSNGEAVPDATTSALASLSSISAEDMATAAKVALLMAHPLEAPKRVACAICQKRFKNQSALNGHMRLHGGYGTAGLVEPGGRGSPSRPPSQQSRVRDAYETPRKPARSDVASSTVATPATTSNRPPSHSVTRFMNSQDSAAPDLPPRDLLGHSSSLSASFTGLDHVLHTECLRHPTVDANNTSHRSGTPSLTWATSLAGSRSEPNASGPTISEATIGFMEPALRKSTSETRLSVSRCSTDHRTTWWQASSAVFPHSSVRSPHDHSGGTPPTLPSSADLQVAAPWPETHHVLHRLDPGTVRSAVTERNFQLCDTRGGPRTVVDESVLRSSRPMESSGLTLHRSSGESMEQRPELASQQQSDSTLVRIRGSFDSSCPASDPPPTLGRKSLHAAGHLPTGSTMWPRSGGDPRPAYDPPTQYSPVTPACSAGPSGTMAESVFTFPPVENTEFQPASIRFNAQPTPSQTAMQLDDGTMLRLLTTRRTRDNDGAAIRPSPMPSAFSRCQTRWSNPDSGFHPWEYCPGGEHCLDPQMGQFRRPDGFTTTEGMSVPVSDCLLYSDCRTHPTATFSSTSAQQQQQQQPHQHPLVCANSGSLHRHGGFDPTPEDPDSLFADLGLGQFVRSIPPPSQPALRPSDTVGRPVDRHASLCVQPYHDPMHHHPTIHGRHSFPSDQYAGCAAAGDGFFSSASSRSVRTQQSSVPSQSSRWTAQPMPWDPYHHPMEPVCDSEGQPQHPRTRHISAPLPQPDVLGPGGFDPAVQASPWPAAPRATVAQTQSCPPVYHTGLPTSSLSSSSSSSGFILETGENQEEAVANLLMQSHICDSPPGLSSSATATTYSSFTHNSPVLAPASSTHTQSTTTGTSAAPMPRQPPHEPFERFELADLTTITMSGDGLGGGDTVGDDDPDASAITRLTKSLADDNLLFRNPHTLPPPKKFKRKPAPIFIPPQTGANLSRLRSPRVWTSEASAMHGSPPPYTPPPMLSPNRRGSGLFSSLSRWPSTSSPARTATLLLARRNSVGPPTLSRRGSGAALGGAPLKRSYTSSFAAAAGERSPEDDAAFEPGERNLACAARRKPTAALPPPPLPPPPSTSSHRTPKSAPIVLSDLTVPDLVNCSDTLGPDARSVTVFGYDDETMRRFAEADAARLERRVSARRRRRCDAMHTESIEAAAVRGNEVPEKVSKLECCDLSSPSLMNYKREDALELVEDTLAELDQTNRLGGTTSVELDEEGEDVYEDELEEEDEDEDEGVPSSLIPHINIGAAFQADVPDFCIATATHNGQMDCESEPRETLLWCPDNLDERDPKNIESLNLLMKIACSPAVRNCGLNMEYTFHLLCKYKGNLEMTLHSLLYETLVVYDYVYAETTAWTTEEIARFQYGLRVYGRDFHHVAKDLQANGMNKTVKACVEFYYVWKRMNTPSDVKWYRERARRQRHAVNHTDQVTAADDSHPCGQDVGPPDTTVEASHGGSSVYNLRNKHHPVQPFEVNVSCTAPGDDSMRDSALHEFPQPFAASVFDYDATSVALKPEPQAPSRYAPAPTSDAQMDSHSTASFPCHVCSRVFTKVKSRNAHMKSHAASHKAPTLAE